MSISKNHLFAFLFILGSAFYGSAQTDTTAAKAEIHWLSFEEAYELNKTTPKIWLVDVSTSWCGWCKRMDATTFSDPLIIDYVNKNYYAVALDGEEKKDIVLDTTTFKFVESGRRGYHELPAKLMGGKMSYPTIVFLNPQVQVYQALPGYKSKTDFLPIIQYIKGFEKNPNLTWGDYMKSYVSPYPE